MYLENLLIYFHETFTEMKSIIRRRAEDKNDNTGLLSLGIKSFWMLKLMIFVINLCQPCNFKTIWDVLIKLYWNI